MDRTAAANDLYKGFPGKEEYFVKASIIIPSYNARERLYLNLTALNQQSYVGDDVEVIVVDNGSTDNTMKMLDHFTLKYPLKTVRIEENRGIAFGRNAGILRAEGDILIFHDSDMIASKDLIKLHLDLHKEPNIVVCGLFWRRIFTYYYKKFTPDQFASFEKIRKKSKLYQAPFRDAYPLINPDFVTAEDLLEYSFDLDFGFINDLKSIIGEYGRTFEGYYLPWRFFITNNISVDREIVMKAGMFDTNIVRYGYEDYDLGIRLYKSGCRFIMGDHIVSLHQEHPANYRPDDLVVNVNYICNKYNNIYFIDVPLVCLSDSLNLDKTQLNEITRDIYQLVTIPEYHEILELFLKLLQVLRKRFFDAAADNGREVFLEIAKDIGHYIEKVLKLQRQVGVPSFIRQLSYLFKVSFNVDFERLLKVNE